MNSSESVPTTRLLTGGRYRCMNCDQLKIADRYDTFIHLTPEAAEHCARYTNPDWAKRVASLVRNLPEEKS